MTELTLELTHHLPHAPERVFDAWLDPEMLAKFMLPGANMSVGQTTTDPRVGGSFLITMIPPEGSQLPPEMPHQGTYLEISRATRLQFTWASFNSQEDSTVTLDFAANNGGTDLTLTHIRFPSEESRDNHISGWTNILQTLETTL